MGEANRVYRLLARRAREMNMERTRVIEEIVKPVRDLLLAHSGSEAVIRTVSADKFVGAIQTIRSLRIPQERIEVEIEALPRVGDPTPKQWTQRLKKLAKSQKLRISKPSLEVARRSQAHPEFGIVKVRVLALSGPGVGELRGKTQTYVSDRAGSGWRVGCFYAIAAITALIWSKPN
jgi:hypothetical protein